jgi:hypothetical protein
MFLFALCSLAVLGPAGFLTIIGFTLLIRALGSIGNPRS